MQTKKITIRPSGVDAFFECPYKWYRNNLYKPIRIIGSAAHFGTGIHKTAEIYYNECIAKKEWQKPSKELKSVAVDTLRECFKKEEPNDLKELNINQVEKNISEISFNYVNNAKSLNNEKIPLAVEKTYEVKINSPIIDKVKGTLDIIGDNYIADIKTMGKLKSAKTYANQQGIYAFLRKLHKESTNDLIIHRLNTSKNTIDTQSIMSETFTPIDALINQSKFYLESIVKTCDAFYKTGDEMLFRGNPNSLLCSEKYCAYYNDCKWRKQI